MAMVWCWCVRIGGVMASLLHLSSTLYSTSNRRVYAHQSISCSSPSILPPIPYTSFLHPPHHHPSSLIPNPSIQTILSPPTTVITNLPPPPSLPHRQAPLTPGSVILRAHAQDHRHPEELNLPLPSPPHPPSTSTPYPHRDWIPSGPPRRVDGR